MKKYVLVSGDIVPHDSWSPHYMEMSSEFHVPAALPPRNSSQIVIG
jgi:hypothetical protein